MWQRRKSDKEFKLMTFEFSKNREDLKVMYKEPDIIYRWRRKFLDKKTESFPGFEIPPFWLKNRV